MQTDRLQNGNIQLESERVTSYLGTRFTIGVSLADPARVWR